MLKRLLVSGVAVAMTVSMVPAMVMAKELDKAEANAAVVVSDNEGVKSFQPAKLGGSPTVITGKCGSKLDYVLDGTGTLTIKGSGSMSNFKSGRAPWYGYRAKIVKVVFSGSVSSIGAYAFQGTSISSIAIPGSVKSVGNCAFYKCTSLTKVSGGSGVITIGASAFSRCSKLSSFTITSKKLKKIGKSAFYKDKKLKTITIKKTTKLTKKGVKGSLKGSSVKKVKVKKSKRLRYTMYFLKMNSGKRVKVK